MERRMKPEILSAIEKSVTEIASRQRHDFTAENRILFTYAENERMSPDACAEKVNALWNMNETGKTVISTFRRAQMVPQERRERYFHRASGCAERVARYLTGERFQTTDLDQLEADIGDSSQVKRAALLKLCRMLPQLRKSSVFPLVLKLNKDFAGECLDSILSLIRIELGGTEDLKEYEKEILRLEAELKRANRMLVRLQDDFDERIEENRREEGENLIAQLNSARYGGILDMLTTLQTGSRSLRRGGKTLPVELSSLPALLRNLLQFAEDCGITPMMTMGEEFTLKASEAANYQYRGTPFASADEEKPVIVTSTGWEIRDKELIISLPAVTEKE